MKCFSKSINEILVSILFDYKVSNIYLHDARDTENVYKLEWLSLVKEQETNDGPLGLN